MNQQPPTNSAACIWRHVNIGKHGLAASPQILVCAEYSIGQAGAGHAHVYRYHLASSPSSVSVYVASLLLLPHICRLPGWTTTLAPVLGHARRLSGLASRFNQPDKIAANQACQHDAAHFLTGEPGWRTCCRLPMA